MSALQPILIRLAEGERLDRATAGKAFDIIMSGKADGVEIAAFLMALRVRGETVGEIAGGVDAMRDHASRIDAPDGVVDTCGTGGDGLDTVNISTTAALVAAAAGVPVAKHGNRSVSSKSGSSDVLMALGARLEQPLERVSDALREFGFTFLYAPAHHSAMRHAAPVRKALGVRTIFNLLGPLANPAGATRQVIGVYSAHLLQPMAEVLRELGADHVWVVHGRDGMDELSVSEASDVVVLKDDDISDLVVTPEQVGLMRHGPDALAGGSAEDNARDLRDVLDGEAGAYRDAVLMNAGAALVVGGRAEELSDGVQLAAHAIDSGKARDLLDRWIAFTQDGTQAGTEGGTPA